MIAAALSLVLAAPPGLPGDADLIGSARFHFPQRINAVAAAPSGERVAVSTGPEVVITAARSGARVARFHAPCSPIDSLAWTPDGEVLAGGCNSTSLGNARVFAWRPGREAPAFSGSTPAAVTAVAFVVRREGLALVAGERSGHLTSWQLDGGDQLGRVDAGVGRVLGLAGTAGRVAVRGETGVAIAAVAGPAERVFGAAVDAAAWTPTGTLVLAGSDGVRLVTPGSRQPLRFLAAPAGAGPARAIHGDLIAWAGAGVHALAGGRLVPRARAPFAADGAVTFSADGGLAISTGAQRDVLGVYDLRADEAITQGHRAAVTQFAVSPGGDQVATIDLDGAVVLWRLADGQPLTRWQVSPPEAWLFAPDDALVAFVGDDELIAGSGSGGMYRLGSSHAAQARAERRHVTQARLSRGGDRGIFIWRTGEAEVRALGPKGDRTLWTLNKKVKRAGRAQRVDISDDGRLVLAVGARVFVLDAATGAVRWQGEGRDAALSADGQAVVVLEGDEITVRALPGGDVLRRYPAEGATAVAADATGERVAFATRDGLYLAQGHHTERLGPAGFTRPVDSLRFAGAHLLAHPNDAPYVHSVALDVAPEAIPTAFIAQAGPALEAAPAPPPAVVAAVAAPEDEDDLPPAAGDGPVDVLADLVAQGATH